MLFHLCRIFRFSQNSVNIILKGKVKTFKANEDGKELTIGLYNAGDFLGFIPLLENEVYKETAEALEE
ncbi:MAG: Crp/Fnr family transcriptional regulator, partial [bacterium]